MKKSLRNYRLFFHRMGLLFLFIPLIVLILSIVLPADLKNNLKPMKMISFPFAICGLP